MGERTRHHDWSQTPLGTPDQWPQSLRTSVSILLNSRFPMFVWWGKHLTTIYNDAYKIIAGDKHPALLGRSGREAWSEIWEDLAPLVRNVFNGTSTWSEDLMLHIRRRDFIEETYFTFSYSPILDETGSVAGLFCAVVETTEKVFSKRKLQESEQGLRNVILQAPFATCIFRGPAFVIEVANPSMLQFWGKTAEAVLHKPLFEALPEAKDQGFEERMLTVLRTGEDFAAREQAVTLLRNGSLQKFFINFTYRAIRGLDGKVTGIIAVAVDVTDQVTARKKKEESEAELQKRVEERTKELAAINKELQRSNAHLEEFAHAASHDLKEPIRKIHFFTERLKTQLSDKLCPDDIRMFERVEHASQRMNSLIDDLLLYSHVSQKPHQKEAVNLNEKIKWVLEDLELDIEERAAVVRVDGLPVVQGYKRQLQQLFHNLLTNALKYSKAGRKPEIEITATTVTGAEAGLLPDMRYHRVTVRDNGIGFEQDQAEKIFLMFQRLHGKTEYEGTGVGLSIARKVAENHGGKITAHGEPDKGATFTLYLPVE